MFAATHIDHESWMQRCLELAERGAGCVSPNPLVGAVLVYDDGTVLGEGWHRLYGRPHAERNAVEEALRRYGAEALREATLYVNLEPCNHFGKTPPCTELIIEHGIPRVVVGMVDPNPAVNGAGIARLKGQGVDVVLGVREPACQRANEAFTHLLATGRPLVTLKMAQTLDGRVATHTGHSQWISGETSRNLVHTWRASLDAVMVGGGTALADNPSLTIRHVEGRQPWRVVLDREGLLPASLRLFSDEFAGKTIAAVSEDARPSYAASLETAGGEILRVRKRNGRLDLERVFALLGRGTASRPPLQSVLVEAGPSLATALFEHELVDRFFLFIAPKLAGKGMPAVDGLSIDRMSDAKTFAEIRWEQVGEDMLFQGYRRSF